VLPQGLYDEELFEAGTPRKRGEDYLAHAIFRELRDQAIFLEDRRAQSRNPDSLLSSSW